MISRLVGVSCLFIGLVILIATMPADAATSCKDGHLHYGSSAGERSKKVANAKALASWSEFTAYEYGSAWASFERSGSKRVRCSESVSGWGCKVQAVPCLGR